MSIQSKPKKVIPCEVFCRIVGYYRPVQNWNTGKAAEYQDRVFFELSEKDVKESVTESCQCTATIQT